MDTHKASQDEFYFKKLLFDNLTLIIVLEFVVNLYAFNLWVELLLIPSLVFITALKAVAELKEEHIPVKKFADFLLTLFGICLIFFTAYRIHGDYQSLMTSDILRAFLLPPLLTFAYIPYIYLVALLMAYETLFVRLDFLLHQNKSLIKLAKREILAACSVNLSKLKTFAREDAMKFMESTNETDVLNIIKKFKNNQKTKP